MTNNPKLWKTETGDANPKALVIGSGNVPSYLAGTLKQYSCEVNIQYSYSSHIAKYDYIFLFGNFDLLEEIKVKNLSQSGKFVYVETDLEDFEDNESTKDIRVVRAGELDLWTIPDLSEKILHSAFSLSAPRVISARKGIKSKKAIITKQQIIDPPPPSALTENEKDYEDKIASLFDRTIKKTGTEFGKKELIPVKSPLKTRSLRQKLTIIIITLLFAPLFILLGITIWNIREMNSIFISMNKNIAAKDMNTLTIDLKNAGEKIRYAKRIMTISRIPVLGNIPIVSKINETLNATETLVTSSEEIISIIQSSSGTGFSLDPNSFEEVKLKIEDMITAIYTIRENTEDAPLPYFPKDTLLNYLSFYKDNFSEVYDLLPLAESIIFDSSPRIYLLLFQNSMELRPTGGFIGSFGLMLVDKGKISELKIFDVYTADGQLKGHVDPPNPIRKYLNQPNWFLRDSNFDPDFAVSAQQAMWFLKKELNFDADAVVGVNSLMIVELLKITGPVRLSDFGNDEISADNFHFKSQQYIEKGFFAGSSGKKDFLTAVFNSVQLKIFSPGNTPWLEILTAAKKGLDEKNIMFYSRNQVMQDMIEKKGWGGRITKNGCIETSSVYTTGSSCSYDYLALVESNMGISKANYFVSKSVSVEKILNDDGGWNNTVSVFYENTNLEGALRGSDYINYMRFLVPKGAIFESASLNGYPLPAENITLESYGTDKEAIALFFKIASGNRGTLRVTYKIAAPNVQSKYHQFFFQKQPGDKISPFVLTFKIPENKKLVPLNFPSKSSNPSEIYYTTDTSVDRVFTIGESN